MCAELDLYDFFHDRKHDDMSSQTNKTGYHNYSQLIVRNKKNTG